MENPDSKELVEAQAHIWNHTFNYLTSMALRCAVQLAIPDIISDQGRPVTLSELVTQLSIPPAKSRHLQRVMRLLVHTGFFSTVKKDDQDQEGYALTYSSKLLLKKQPTVAPLVRLMTEPVHVTPCLFIADWLQGAEATPFETVYGMSVYEYYAKHSDVGKIFNDAMASDSELMIQLLLKDLKPMLEGCETLVDVGGNVGAVAKAISEAVPNLKCTVYDLPHVVSASKDAEDMKDITFVAGSMFEFVPSANVLFFKDVLIDWSDENCLKALTQCRKAISRENEKGKVIIVEAVTNSVGDAETIKSHLCFDVSMMTCLTGKERTETEWKKIYQEAGFTSHKLTISLGGVRSIIEVFP